MSNILTYPFKTMRFSQNYNAGNHVAHSSGSPKDYPVDEAGADGTRDWFYCPCDEVKITKLYGNDSAGRHIWLESTTPVLLANGKTDYITIFAVHLNYDDYSRLSVGQTFKRGTRIFKEGTSGHATGNHIHMAVGLGRSSSNKTFWVKNSKDVYVLLTPNGPIKPEQAFYIDPDFTKILDSKTLKFKILKETEDMSRGYFMQGDANEGVLALNTMLYQLKSLGVISTKVTLDKNYTSTTKNAVLEVQAKANLAKDGKAGPLTIKACGTLINDVVKAKNASIDHVRDLYTEASRKISQAKKALE